MFTFSSEQEISVSSDIHSVWGKMDKINIRKVYNILEFRGTTEAKLG